MSTTSHTRRPSAAARKALGKARRERIATRQAKGAPAAIRTTTTAR